jgi:hypothetical protein
MELCDKRPSEMAFSRRLQLGGRPAESYELAPRALDIVPDSIVGARQAHQMKLSATRCRAR